MKAKCLLILPRPVFPTVGGYAIKNKQLIDILHQHYDLTLVVLSDHPIMTDEKEFYTTHSSLFRYFYYPKIRYWFNAFRALFSSKPLQVGYFYYPEVQKFVNQHIQDQNIVVGVLIRSMAYLQHRPQNTIAVFDMVDSIALNYQRSIQKVHSLFWKCLYKIEKNRLFKAEEYWVSQADITYLFNNEECKYWQKFGHVELVPHGVYDKLFLYEQTDPKFSNAVVFIGKMDYQPNIDAVVWYIKNVHSIIGDKVPFIIVGAYPTKEVYNLAQHFSNIEITGFVDDPYLIIKSSLLVIAPMQTGGGIQNKILESMALGKIVLTSSIAASPIVGAQHNQHFMIADTPSQYIDTILKIREHPEQYQSIGNAARQFIQQHYTWAAYAQKYIAGIEKELQQKTTLSD